LIGRSLLTSFLYLQVAQIVKNEMECAIKLSVKLKVKVKIGASWGELKDFDV
jgi:DNA polymerase theta